LEKCWPSVGPKSWYFQPLKRAVSMDRHRWLRQAQQTSERTHKRRKGYLFTVVAKATSCTESLASGRGSDSLGKSLSWMW
jgi:hypothetical protein